VENLSDCRPKKASAECSSIGDVSTSPYESNQISFAVGTAAYSANINPAARL
jgi:hypothetical protein